MQEELAEAMQRYWEKVSQWEKAHEALDLLTDELEANRNLMMESQRKADRLKGQTGTLREQVGTFKQQGGARSQKHMKGRTPPGLQLYYFLTSSENIAQKSFAGSRLREGIYDQSLFMQHKRVRVCASLARVT